MFFDSHAHYDDKRFDGDRFETITKVFNSGVTYILNASADIRSSRDTVSLTKEYEFIYGAVGIHPHNAAKIDNNTFGVLEELTKNDKIVAIGEIGLDYHYNFSPKEIQKFHFANQIAFAKKLNLPIIVHDRDAHRDVMDIVSTEGAEDIGGVFHCYSGSVEMLRDVLDMNFHISVGGVLTFKNVKKLIEVVKYVPMDRLLIETDCPYLAPEPYRGRRNDSGYIHLVAKRISELRGMSEEEVAQITLNNAKNLFKIK